MTFEWLQQYIRAYGTQGEKCKGKQAITVHPSKEQTKLQYFFKKEKKRKESPDVANIKPDLIRFCYYQMTFEYTTA